MRLTFLGASRQVTGSSTLVEVAGKQILVDCGLFQERAFLERNWESPPYDPKNLDAVLLTHGHLDHTGLVPRLVAQGYRGQIITTEPSVEIAGLIMKDSARIQAEDVRYKKKRHKREHRRDPRPIVPLYSSDDALHAVEQLHGVTYNREIELGPHATATFFEAGHILGSASIELELRENGVTRHVVFSGDIGQWGKPLIGDPTLLHRADAVVMESTYGDRVHREAGDIPEQLARVIGETAARGGNVIIPTFAVERAQELVYHIGELKRAKRIPDLSVYLDSPMAVDVTEVFLRYRHYLDADTQRLFRDGEAPLRYPGVHLVRSSAKSKAIAHDDRPKIIMSTSGMCTAGRIKHHLRQNIERPECTILFVGYQPRGTLGHQILAGDDLVRIHGRHYSTLARVEQLYGCSAHGDRDDLLRWIAHFDPAPKHIFLNHGESEVAEKLARRIAGQTGAKVEVPDYREEVELA